MKYLTALFLALSIYTNHHAQCIGTLQGKVTEGETLETAIFAAIYAVPKGTTILPDSSFKTMSDIDGNYTLNLPCGKYDILVQYIGFPDTKKENCLIKTGHTTKLDITLSAPIATATMLICVKTSQKNNKKKNPTGAQNKIENEPKVVELSSDEEEEVAPKVTEVKEKVSKGTPIYQNSR